MEELSAYLEGQRKGEFARKVGIAPAYLSQIMSGHRRPSFDLMLKIKAASDGAVSLEAWERDRLATTEAEEPAP